MFSCSNMISIILLAMLPIPLNQLPTISRHRVEVESGTYLFRHGDKPWAFYFVESGTVRLVRHSRSGEEIVIHRSLPNETFAEASLFSDAYHCDAIAETDAVLFQLDKQATLRLMEADPKFGMLLAARFAQQVQQYRRRIELFSIRSAEHRVFVAVEEGWLTGDIKEFSSQIGLSHEATYRALSQLVQKGRLRKIGRGKYCALDPPVGGRSRTDMD